MSSRTLTSYLQRQKTEDFVDGDFVESFRFCFGECI